MYNGAPSIINSHTLHYSWWGFKTLVLSREGHTSVASALALEKKQGCLLVRMLMKKIIYYSVKRRTPIYSISPVLTSAECPGPKQENCSNTIRTWNTHHSRAVHANLHQTQHVEELYPLTGYHYRCYIPSGFGYRSLNLTVAVSHGNPYTKLCRKL